METNTSESLIKCRKRRDVIKTRGESLTWDKPGGDLLTVQAVAGMKAAVNMAQAPVWNVGTYDTDVKGEIQVVAPQG
jgi:hypothetical protein